MCSCMMLHVCIYVYIYISTRFHVLKSTKTMAKMIVIRWVRNPLPPSRMVETLKMEVSINGGTPKWMVYKGKSHLEMDDLGIPPLWKHPYEPIYRAISCHRGYRWVIFHRVENPPARCWRKMPAPWWSGRPEWREKDAWPSGR